MMKQLTALQQHGRRSGGFRSASESSADGSIKSPATVFWLLIHGFCCLISLLLGFRFSRLVLFLLISPSATTIYTALRTTMPPEGNSSAAVGGGSRVVVGRHGILIRPWPHPDPAEVMKAHKIIDRVQFEQRFQFGEKNPRMVIAITPTYVRTFQALHLTGVMHCLMNVPYDVVWIVVEASGATNDTAVLVSQSGLKVIHIGFDGDVPRWWEDRRKFESKMRLHALRVVKEKRLDGIVVFADDSNMHSLELFDEIQKVKWIGAVSIGILGRSRTGIQTGDKRSQVPVQGPACNSSGHLVGWHIFDMQPFLEKGVRYIGDGGEKLEWAGFVLNSRLVWDDTDKPGWVKELDEVSKDGEDVNNPLSLLSDTSVAEPLGSCGRKVLVWWLRVEARVDSKFPARWIIDPPLSITVPAKRTPWPDTPPDLPTFVEKSSTESHTTKRRKHRSRKRAANVLDEEDATSTLQSEGN